MACTQDTDNCLRIDEISYTSVKVHTWETEGSGVYNQSITLYASDGTTVVDTETTPASGDTYVTFTGLTPNTTYEVVWDNYPETREAFTTLPDDPKTATQSQWEDLAAKVKAKADSSSIPTVNDSTITVTNNGTSKGTFTTNQASAGSVALDYPVITMTTTDPGEGSALAENNYIGVYGGDPIIMDYSTSEMNTGMKWIDGSAIYKKTINFGSLPNNTSKQVAHNISSLGRIIKIDGIMNDSSNTHFWTIPYLSVNNIEVFSGNIQITTTLDLTSYTAYITLYYTKSS